ncbi:MAG TPA: type II toxin-antitoxin system VapC family toxin [Candidatus Nanoarchaeia archaeon]|nr:type II toxin-antitoxin system VapC family toxin [Candidatus Nanoarchaeia archaeon]
MRLFIDTSIFVDCLRKEVVKSSKLFLESLVMDNIGFTSAITVAELSVGAHLSQRSDALEKTLELLSIVEIIDIDKDVAVEGGKIYSKLVKKGKSIELNDCLISATSISQGINKIVTRNVSHFERIEEIEVLTPEDLGF